MFGNLAQAMFGACNNGANGVERAAEVVTTKVTVPQLLESLDGLSIQVNEAPDIHVTILEVEKRDGLDTADPCDFSLTGMNCRTKLSVSGSAAQLAGMVASKAAQKVLGTAALLIGSNAGKAVAENMQRITGPFAKNAAEASETKSAEAALVTGSGTGNAAAGNAQRIPTPARNATEASRTRRVEGRAAEVVATKATVLPLLESLHGLCIQVSEAPDIHVTILEVEKRDGLDAVDPWDFSLTGLKCRTKLSVAGSAAQLAGMVASKAAQKVLGKAALLTGSSIGNTAAENTQKFHGSLARNAAEASETKSVEATVYLDLEMRGNEAVTAVVSIAPNAFKSVEQLLPLPTAVGRMEVEIARTVQAVLVSGPGTGDAAAETAQRIHGPPARNAAEASETKGAEAAAENTQQIHGSSAQNAAGAPETTSVEARMYLDLEVRGNGAVTAAVSIAPNTFKSVEQLLPLQTAVGQIETEVARRVQALLAQ